MNIGDIVKYKDNFTEGEGEIILEPCKITDQYYLVRIGVCDRAYYDETGHTSKDGKKDCRLFSGSKLTVIHSNTYQIF